MEPIADESTETSGTDTGSLDCGLSDDETGMVIDMPDEPADDVWLVVNFADQVIGELAASEVDSIVDHDDVFSEGSPVFLHLTRDGFGFVLNEFAASYIVFNHDVVHYTGPDCTGTPVDLFATVKETDSTLSQGDCNIQSAMLLGDAIVLHYGYQEVAQAWVNQNWPDALGVVVHQDALDARWFWMPVDQNWPEWRTTQSVLHHDGSCSNEESAGCMVSFIESDWTPPAVVGPKRLVFAPAP